MTSQSSDDFHRLIGKAVFDPDFTEALVADPKQALESIGVEITPEIESALEGIDLSGISDSFKQLATAFGDFEAAVG